MYYFSDDDQKRLKETDPKIQKVHINVMKRILLQLDGYSPRMVVSPNVPYDHQLIFNESRNRYCGFRSRSYAVQIKNEANIYCHW